MLLLVYINQDPFFLINKINNLIILCELSTGDNERGL